MNILCLEPGRPFPPPTPEVGVVGGAVMATPPETKQQIKVLNVSTYQNIYLASLFCYSTNIIYSENNLLSFC